MEHTATTWTTEDLLRHHPWARSLARHLVGDDATADDVAQESMILALERAPSGLKGTEPQRSWLGTVVRNVARQRARAEGRRTHREREAAPKEALPSALDMTAFAEGQRLLIDALLTLDEDSRHLVLLRYYEGLTAAEIARRSDRSAGTVRSKIKRALERLREELDQRHGGDRDAWHAAIAPLALGAPARGLAAGVGASTGLSAGVKWLTALAATAAAAAALVQLKGPGSLFDERVAPTVLSPSEFAELRGPSDQASSLDASTGRESLAPAPEAARTAAMKSSEAAGTETPATAAAETKTGTIRLRLLDEAARPIEGVEVSARAEEAVRSGADGRAEIDVFLGSPSYDITLRLRHRGHASDQVNVRGVRGETVDAGDFTLRAGGDVRGRVIDPNGRPLGGIRVFTEGLSRRVSSSGGISSYTSTGIGRTEATTDELGQFELFGVCAGEVEVLAESADEVWTGKLSPLVVPIGGPRKEHSENVLITVQEVPVETRIQGVVLDHEGQPARYAGIRLEWRRFFSSSFRTLMTDAEGRFMEVVPKGVSADMWFSGQGEALPRASREGVKAGTLDLTVRLAPPRALRVFVTGSDEGPLSGALVGIAVADAFFTRVETDIEGVAVLPRPLGDFDLLVRAPGHAEFKEEYAALPDGDDQADPHTLPVALRSLPQLTGRVVAGGQSVPGASLSLRPTARNKVVICDLPALVENHVEARGNADDEGAFALTVQESGRYVLRAEAPGLAPAEYGPFDYSPEDGLADIELTLTAGGTVEGRVFDGDALRQRHVVLLSRGDGVVRTVRTGLDGDYRFDHVAPGPCFVRVVPEMNSSGVGDSMSSMGFPYRSIDGDALVQEGSVTRYDLSVGGALPRATLRGKIAVTGFEPNRLRASLRGSSTNVQAGGYDVTARLDADGAFELQGGSPGGYELLLTDATSDEDMAALRLVIPLDLSAGINEWELDLGFGEIRTGPNADPAGESLLWRGPRGAFGMAALAPQGASRPFPAGSVSRARTLDVMVLSASLDDLDRIDPLESFTLAADALVATGR